MQPWQQIRSGQLSSTMKILCVEQVTVGNSVILTVAVLVGHEKSKLDDVNKLRAQLDQIIADCEIVMQRFVAKSQAFNSVRRKSRSWYWGLQRALWSKRWFTVSPIASTPSKLLLPSEAGIEENEDLHSTVSKSLKHLGN
ncbi:unnamed protein product [Brassica napus]|uniref:(rape) hypothetical protein n=1 Tax=Brassica napus TaxID=3708 RepID=A0A816N0D6_BRANA|nr:unnamed protein product [Brassica napus]